MTARVLSSRLALVTLATLLGAAGCCSTKPYRYCGDYHTERDAGLEPGEAQIERGKKRPVIDGIGWVVGIPSKILMLDHRVNNHNVSPETEATIAEYLAVNGLDKVKVRVNEYDPGGEWHRLVDNKSVAWPIRYTIGTLSVAAYTVLPGRVFGGDAYNPFTNTINVYSDVPALALYDGGYAKDYAQRQYKGLYAVGYIVPGVGLWQDVKASSDAMRYVEETGTVEEVKGAYRSLTPTFAMRAVAPIDCGCVSLCALAAGHISGQTRAFLVEDVPMLPAGESVAQASVMNEPLIHTVCYESPAATYETALGTP